MAIALLFGGGYDGDASLTFYTTLPPPGQVSRFSKTQIKSLSPKRSSHNQLGQVSNLSIECVSFDISKTYIHRNVEDLSSVPKTNGITPLSLWESGRE
jgi:hypothetical protein